jgi:hypothetical protein
MTDPRGADTTPLNAPGVDVADTLRELSGEEPRERQDGILEPDQIDVDSGFVTDTQLYEGESRPTGPVSATTSRESLELLEDLDLRSDETTDAMVASDEGLPWVPPIDPPVVPSDNPGGVEIAAGFGSSSLDEPYDLSHHSELLPGDDEMTDRVREALRADASTTEYADAIEIETDGSTVILRGVAEDLEDDDNLVAVASTVAGVDEVVDELDVK